jgi:hypothetical protein
MRRIQIIAILTLAIAGFGACKKGGGYMTEPIAAAAQ